MTDIEARILQYIKEGNVQEASFNIKKALEQGINLSSNHVLYSHVLTLSAPWADIARLIPRQWNFLLGSGWLNSISKSKPINSGDQPIPWLTYPAIEFLETIIKPDWSVFEWGSGNSTMWWSERVKSVRAVENNYKWYEIVSKEIKGNTFVSYANDVDSYLKCYLDSDEAAYDVVVIDGVYRNECAEIVHKKLKSDGIIVFDNSDRMSEDKGVQLLTDSDFFRLDFWGMIPSYLYKNCTSIFFSNINVLKHLPVPSQLDSCLGPSCQQSIDRRKSS